MSITYQHQRSPGKLASSLGGLASVLLLTTAFAGPLPHSAPQDGSAGAKTVGEAEAQFHALDQLLQKEVGIKGFEKKSGTTLADIIRSIEKVNTQMVPDSLGPLIPLGPAATPTPTSALAPTPSPRPRRTEKQELSDAVQKLHRTLETVSKRNPDAPLSDSTAKELRKILQSLSVPSAK